MDKVIIFDTTLRDGEQAAGGTLNVQEKLEIARQLEKLKVDVIEAGFPVSSQGDFEAVKLIAKEVHTPVICALARAVLAGEKGPRRDIVLFNASAAIVAGGKADDLRGGVAAAAESIDSGAAAEKLDALVRLTREA